MKITRISALLLLFILVVRSVEAAPEQWAKDIDRLTAADPTPAASHDVVFVGSSSIRFWTSLATDFPGIDAVNRGFGGSELADSVAYAGRLVLAYHPRIVVLYAGDNDLWGGKSPAVVAADFRAFRTKIHAALPRAKVIYLSIKASPSRARIRGEMTETNRLIAADCAANPNCEYVDVATPMLDPEGHMRPELFRDDQLHMKPAGYAIWTQALALHLKP